MARMALTLGVTAAGAVMGAQFGAPMLGAQLGFMAGSIASALLFPGGEDQQGPRLGDLRVSDASYGTPIPIVYGAVRVAGILIWTSGIEERADEQSMKGGGPTSTSYSYYASFAVGLCEGPLAHVRKIWLDTKLVYDMSQNNLGMTNQRIGDLDQRHLLSEDALEDRRDEIQAELAEVQSALTIYVGSETQLPDPTIEAHAGVGQVPAHRGLAYLVFQDLPLMAYGNRIPNISAEVMTQSAPAYPRRTITPGAQLHVDQMLFDPTRQMAWDLYNGNLTVVDTLTNTLLRSGPIDTSLAGNVAVFNGFGMGCALDQDGYLYVALDNTATTMRLGRVDPVSFAVTHVNENAFTLLPEPIGPCFAIQVSQTFVWWTSILYGDLAYCFLRPGAINPRDGQPVIHMSAVTSIPFAAVPGAFGKAIAIAADETAWIVCSPRIAGVDQGTWLLHMEPTGAYQVYDLSADVGNGAYIAYDAQTHALLIAGTRLDNTSVQRIVRFDIATTTVTATSPDSGAGALLQTAWRRGVIGREIWWNGGINDVYAFDVDSLTFVRQLDLGEGWAPAGNGYSGYYDPGTQAFFQVEAGVGFAKYFLDRLEPQPVTLGSIVGDMARRSGLQADDIDTAALTAPVWGFAVSQQSAARASLESLLSAFLADGVETDWRLHFQHRALAPVATLTRDDLGADVPPTTTLPDVVTTERLDDQALPMRLDVTYADPFRDYQDTTQHARRFQAGQRARSARQVRTPVILTADQARQLAEQSLHEAWVSRTTYRFATPYRWTTLDPGDVVVIDQEGRSPLIRVQQIEHGANGLLAYTGVAYDRELYTAGMMRGVVADAETAQTIPMLAPTGLFLVDTHLLQDIDEGSGYYMAMTPQGSGDWPGATAFSSLDGAAWRQDDTLTTPIAWGSAATVLEEGSPYVIDYGHTVDVTMARGTLSSISMDELLNGANGGLLGNEILQWQTATALDARTWRLSNLLRGRRGTEWAIPGHRLGDRFLVLTTATVRREQMGLAEVGTARLYRAVTGNTDVLTTTGQAFTNTALGLKPYSPDHVHGTRNASNDLTVTWVRRTRLGGLWIDGRDVLLGERTEAYEVDIVVSGAVVRTLPATIPSVTYTAANQTTDGIIPGTAVTVTVYQLGLLGRGWGTTVTI